MTSPDHHARVSDLFLQACDLPIDERPAFLDEACGDDEHLRRDVQSLLAHDSQAAVVDEPLVDVGALSGQVAAADAPIERPMPTQIGPYEILGLLGEGGMGTVYRAQQTHPSRLVALKVIRSGLTTRSLIRRFEAEVQVLGRLKHPGIAQIYEAGRAETEMGIQPYFAMELVEGVPLLDYARAKDLDTNARLDLVAMICDAVDHAHQNGVIHRDLKPGNVLVSPAGQPTILDFGIARVTDSDIRTTSLHTDAGQLLGTIPYMSPEQVVGDRDDLDTRLDIYAIGVITYELLTGRLPYGIEDKTIPEACRIIRDEEPTRLSSLSRTFRGDIDTIVAKTLEKDPARRYQTAAGLAADIRRSLRNEPIIARPPSAVYQLGKFARRNRALVTATGLVFVALVVALIISTTALIRSRDEADRTASLNLFLNDMLASANPYGMSDTSRPAGLHVTVAEMLDDAAARLETSFEDQPQVAAIARATIGRTYKDLGRFEDALHHLEIARTLIETHGTPDDALLPRVLDAMGVVYAQLDRLDEAEAIMLEMIAIERATRGEKHIEVAEALGNLGWLAMKRTNYEEGRAYILESLDMYRELEPDGTSRIAKGLNNLARAEGALGNLDAAEANYRQALGMFEEVYGPQHPNVGHSKNNLATILARLGRFDEARPLFEDSIQLLRHELGDSHVKLGNAYNNFASLLHNAGDLDAAEAMYDESLAIYARAVGVEDYDYASTAANRAFVYTDLGRHQAAADDYLLFAEYYLRIHGESHRRYHIGLVYYSQCLNRMDRFDETIPLMVRAEARFRSDTPGDGPHLTSIRTLRAAYAGTGDDHGVAQCDEMLREFDTDG